MELLSILVICLALNLDALFFGIAFGMKNIKILLNSKLIIFFASLLISLLSYTLGKSTGRLLSGYSSHILGSSLMIVVGLLLILRTTLEKEKNPKAKTLINISLKSLGLTIKIIKEPQASDINRSGAIEPFEAIFIAFALSLDALSASFSLGLGSMTKVWTIFLIPVIQFIAISFGNMFGQRLKKIQKNIYINYLPAIALIGLAILNLLEKI